MLFFKNRNYFYPLSIKIWGNKFKRLARHQKAPVRLMTRGHLRQEPPEEEEKLLLLLL
ncbi:MAG: hypothetical protein ACD_57C00191G0002, partial [uncultured bacterium]